MSSTFMHRHSGKVINIAGRVGKCVVNQYDINHYESRSYKDILFTQPGWKDKFSVPVEDFKEYFLMIKPIPGDVLIRGGILYVVEEVTPAEGTCQLRSGNKKLPFKANLTAVSDDYDILTDEAELLLVDGTFRSIKSILPEEQRINVDGANNMSLALFKAVSKYPIERIEKQEAFYATIRAQQNG